MRKMTQAELARYIGKLQNEAMAYIDLPDIKLSDTRSIGWRVLGVNGNTPIYRTPSGGTARLLAGDHLMINGIEIEVV